MLTTGSHCSGACRPCPLGTYSNEHATGDSRTTSTGAGIHKHNSINRCCVFQTYRHCLCLLEAPCQIAESRGVLNRGMQCLPHRNDNFVCRRDQLLRVRLFRRFNLMKPNSIWNDGCACGGLNAGGGFSLSLSRCVKLGLGLSRAFCAK